MLNIIFPAIEIRSWVNSVAKFSWAGPISAEKFLARAVIDAGRVGTVGSEISNTCGIYLKTWDSE